MILFVENYQKSETIINGDRCPLYPTCSEYFKKSYKKNSILSFFLIIERILIRETGNLSKKFTTVPEEFSFKKRFYDPLENSFEKPSLLKEDF